MTHILQPKHVLLSTKQAREVLEKFKASKLQLPKIKLSDPALPQEAKVGDIVKIERKNPDGTKEIYYRIVVA